MSADHKTFTGLVRVQYKIEAEDREAAERMIAGVVASTESTGIRGRSGSDGVATMVKVVGRVKPSR